MNRFAKSLRSLAKLKFRLLGLATIKDIPTDKFKDIIMSLRKEGWKKTYEYKGFDAWIDYGKIKLKKNGLKLVFEWDNWTEGSIEGQPTVLEAIAHECDCEVINEWRWSEYDEKP